MKIIKELKSFLGTDEPFTREIIRNFYIKKGADISEENLKVRIYRLKSKGIIVNIGRGLYILNDKKAFEPELNSLIKKISGKLKKEFTFLNYHVWSSSWLNELSTLHQLRNVISIEIESGSEEVVFKMLKELFPFTVFLNPNENEWENYKSEKSENIIVKTMISESPYKLYHSIKIASLEKILVDLYCDKFWKMIFSSEIDNIYREAISNYVVNFTTLLSYGSRRGRREEIWNYIKSFEILDSLTIKMIER